MNDYSRRTFLKLLASGAIAAAGLGMCPVQTAARSRRTHGWRDYELTAASAEAWLQGYQGKLSDKDMKLLRLAQDTLVSNILTPTPPIKALPWAPLRGIAPSRFVYHGVWNWDSAFHAIAVSRWDAELARDQARIMLSHQLPSGALPDVIYEDGKIVTAFGKPPIWPWALAIIDRRSPNDAFLKEAYDKFVPYEAHWRKNRGGDRDGLFHYGPTEGDAESIYWDAKMESGWDDSVRWDYEPDKQWAIDCNCFMLMLYRAMAYMADRLHFPDDVRKWDDKHNVLASKINEKLWNPAAGAYMDRYIKTGEFNRILSPASFHPLYVRIASREQAAQLAKIAADPKGFYPGMPSVSYGDPKYQSTHYWRGPTWLNIAYFAVKGLNYYGHDQVADDIRRTILDWCSKGDSLHEYYDSKSGKGLGARQYGWSATVVIEFILNWNKKDDL